VLQYLKINVALISEARLKPYMRFCISNYGIYWIDRHGRQKGGTSVEVNKDIPHTYVNLPSFLSVEATGICIPIGNTEMLLAAVYKSPQKVWSDKVVTEFLYIRNKFILAGDLNANHPIWKSKIQIPQACSSSNYLLVLTSKFQLHNALRITSLTVETMFPTLWCLRTSARH
jgi:hypothetical protein